MGRGVRDFKLEFGRNKRDGENSPEENTTKLPRGEHEEKPSGSAE